MDDPRANPVPGSRNQPGCMTQSRLTTSRMPPPMYPLPAGNPMSGDEEDRPGQVAVVAEEEKQGRSADYRHPSMDAVAAWGAPKMRQ